ncbi:hypothetical protein GCM10007391_31280 [Alteromonas halophila]|uniref:Probable membrane transporter protein n=1 Tax=Alteromonas halophila TaxID=516698 RepID=A0A918JPD2_9ALTE|nr:hypothetical protein GCM10007391_31280 [Alteromonas halophila]
MVLGALAFAWLILLCVQSDLTLLLKDYGLFTFLGIFGAIFANATGAGGGVVFVPFFNHLNFAPQAIVATSFGIQCCGMTAGAITWYLHATSEHARDPQWQVLGRGLAVVTPAALCGIWLAQYGGNAIPALSLLRGNLDHLHLGFGIFSIVLALAIYGSVALLNRTVTLTALSQADVFWLPVVGFVGGLITAWLSVGVGELVAVYLIIRGFNVTMSIALAVILSAVSVWAAIGFHLSVTQAVVWQVVLFAGAGAVLGGVIAKYLVLAFSPKHLKIFFGTWVLVLGVSGLPVY